MSESLQIAELKRWKQELTSSLLKLENEIKEAGKLIQGLELRHEILIQAEGTTSTDSEENLLIKSMLENVKVELSEKNEEVQELKKDLKAKRSATSTLMRLIELEILDYE